MPAPHITESAVNRDELIARCLGNEDLADSILERFVVQVLDQFAGIEQAAVRGETETIRAMAHQIRGMAANVAAYGLRRAAGELEDVCRDGEFAGLPQAIENFRFEVERLESHFQPECLSAI